MPDRIRMGESYHSRRKSKRRESAVKPKPASAPKLRKPAAISRGHSPPKIFPTVSADDHRIDRVVELVPYDMAVLESNAASCRQAIFHMRAGVGIGRAILSVTANNADVVIFRMRVTRRGPIVTQYSIGNQHPV